MAAINHQNNFATNLTSGTSATDTTSPLDSIPTVDAPFYIAFDATNINAHYEVLKCTSKTATNVNHAALAYDHTTAEEVRMVVPAIEMDALYQTPRGHLINGKIEVTDAAGITVAIKGLDGNNPSVTNPVYCRIGDTVRTITAALSVAKADGTNWFNAGSAELATKEIYYFVYLGYNATDGVVIGFSRIVGEEYDSFSATTTNEKYCAISTISNAAAGDDYEVIGRFAATLSAGAGYTWSVPTYTNKNLIQRPIFETRWLTWEGTLAWTAGLAPTPEDTNYKLQKYKVCFDKIDFVSTRLFSGSGTTITQVTSTTPFTPLANGLTDALYTFFGSISATAGGAYNVGYASSATNRLVIVCGSATGSQFLGQGFYQI